MTHDDRVAGLGLALEPQDRKETDENPARINVGGLVFRKEDGSSGYGAEFASLLFRNNGTLVWDLGDQISGKKVFNNIYEYSAAEIHAPNRNDIRSRVEAADERAREARIGVQTLSRWLDEQFGIPLYRCSGPGAGNKVTVITVDPDFVVNEDTGETASQVQVARDKKAIQGNIKASFHRLGREEGEAEARRVLASIVEEVTSEMLPNTRRERLT